MAETWYPQAVRLPITVPEYFQSRGMPILAICNHITAGSDSRNWLQHGAGGNASVHFLVRVENGKGVVYQFMPIEFGAWGNGITSGVGNPYMEQWVKDYINAGINPNLYTISIEHEGVAPTAELYTGSMLETTIALQKWIVDTVPTIKRDRAHVLGHYQFDHVTRAFCPGGPGGTLYPFNQIIAALNNVPPAGQPLIIPPSTHPVNGAFKDYYLSRPDALQLWGLPITDERQEKLSDGNTYTVQYFERARFEWHPPNVLLGLLGAELLAK